MFGEREKREEKGGREGGMRVLEVEKQQRQASAAMLLSQASTPPPRVPAHSDTPTVSGASGFLWAL